MSCFRGSRCNSAVRTGRRARTSSRYCAYSSGGSWPYQPVPRIGFPQEVGEPPMYRGTSVAPTGRVLAGPLGFRPEPAPGGNPTGRCVASPSSPSPATTSPSVTQHGIPAAKSAVRVPKRQRGGRGSRREGWRVTLESAIAGVSRRPCRPEQSRRALRRLQENDDRRAATVPAPPGRPSVSPMNDP